MNQSTSSYYCCICLSTFDTSPPAPLSTSSSSTSLYGTPYTLSCGHQFCKSCLQGYFKSRISERNISFRCFFEDKGEKEKRKGGGGGRGGGGGGDHTHSNDDLHGSSSRYLVCGEPISSIEIENLLRDDFPEDLKKYRKFALESIDRSVRFCPFCDTEGRGSIQAPLIECVNCSKKYCFIHSSAHDENSTCEAYEAMHADEEKLNAAATREEQARACPTCGAQIVRSSGCNQLQCAFCKSNFCYLCGQIVDTTSLPIHYQWWNLNSCANRQFGNAMANSQLQRAMNVLFAVIVGFPSTLITAVLFISCPCVCIPATMGFEGSALHFFMTCTSFVALTLSVIALVTFLVPITILGAGVLAVFLTLSLPIRIWKFLRRVKSDLPSSSTETETTIRNTMVALPVNSSSNSSSSSSGSNNSSGSSSSLDDISITVKERGRVL